MEMRSTSGFDPQGGVTLTEFNSFHLYIDFRKYCEI